MDLVPCNKQCSFSTEEQARDFYYLQKDEGKVQVVWLSKAEEKQYGPLSVALF